MKSKTILRLPGTVLALLGLGTHIVLANPTGLSVQSGTAAATTSANGTRLNIAVSQSAILNWQGFNIAAGEQTVFQQPSVSSIVINRITDQNPSQILGSLQANGLVILQNQAGFYFGKDSFVKAAGVIVSTAKLGPLESSGGGGFWQFNGPPPMASIINYGQISSTRGGSVYLISEHIENHGTIKSSGGNVGLLAGENVMVSERPDGRGLSAQLSLPTGSVDNTGRIIADAGMIALNAKTVNQNGLLQANSVREHDGVIELVASQAITLGDNSIITANGGKNGSSAGGSITVESGDAFADSASSQIQIKGGAQGGDGGALEISAPSMAAISSQIDGSANATARGGHILIDPTTITIGATGSGSAGSGTVGSGSTPATLALNVNSSFIGLSQIDLQATGNITVNAPWNLANSTGISTPGSLLKLEAGGNINIANNANIVGGTGWSLTLEAGRNFSSATADAVTTGTGSISFTGNAFLQTRDGSITLLAGKNITVGTGSVTTTGGGNISATAVSGNVNTGSGVNGFIFIPGGYSVDPNLSGISTANGGNVAITAGQNITSYLPVSAGTISDAGSGAFGTAPGNVTLTAGGNVLGHYVVANGTGTITANNAGTASTALALSLVNGSWAVNALQSINLQEVRNPNGIFNERGLSDSLTKHFFDYGVDDFVTLTAGNSVTLGGSSVPRNNDSAFEQSIPSIYPGTLTISAGSGGITLGNDVILFPSPVGQLNVTTTSGGSLIGTVSGDLASLIMSDSGKTQYQSSGDFGISDHAAVPVHLSDNTPAVLSISGDMDNILLGVPKATTLTVGGNMNNSRFEGQNLHVSDVTTISVAGDILNRNDFTSVSLSTAPDFSLFSLIYPPLTGDLANLPTQFYYDATTGQLTFRGRMTGDQESLLLNLQVKVLDMYGNPTFDANGNFITQSAQFISPALVQQLYASSQDIPANPSTGYLLGGGGTFNISARNMDLGATAGIVSLGPKNNNALANYFLHGADINLNLTGNLDMFSTTISSLNGGNISVNVGGTANLGSTFFSGDDSVPRGIFTVQKADVSVIAGGDININGSRIAAYDGGNIYVLSETGSVNAGNGGIGSVPVEEIQVDPVTRQILSFQPSIPGSGILATTFPTSLNPAYPPSANTVGNITVLTPEGSINAASGGIVQLPFNGVNVNAGSITLKAGSRAADGTILYVGDIDVQNSGVIGSSINLDATGSIIGVIVARGNLTATAQQNINVTAFSGGLANVSAGQSLTGTIFSQGGITASAGGGIEASLLSQNITTSGSVGSASQLGFATGTLANATSSSLQNDETARRVASSEVGDNDGTFVKTNGFGSAPRLAKTTGRVTMILPANLPQ